MGNPSGLYRPVIFAVAVAVSLSCKAGITAETRGVDQRSGGQDDSEQTLVVKAVDETVTDSETGRVAGEVTFEWESVPGTEHYRLKVSSSPNCSNPIESVKVEKKASTSLQWTNSGEFHACIESYGGDGRLLSKSKPTAFVVDLPKPDDFSILGPKGIVTTENVAVTWEPAPGKPAYKFALITSKDCSSAEDFESIGTKEKASLSGVSDGKYRACVKAVYSGREYPAKNQGFPLTVDRDAPVFGKQTFTFEIDSRDRSLARLTWSDAGADLGTGLESQEVLLYGDNNQNCAGSPDEIIETEPGTKELGWKRLEGKAAGYVRFRLRLTDKLGRTTVSECSGEVKLRNSWLRFAGAEDGYFLGKKLTTTDLNGDDVKDLVLFNESWDNDRGYITVVLSHKDLGKNQVYHYRGSAETHKFGSSLIKADVNGDGYTDLLSSASDATYEGNTNAGVINVLFGGKDLPDSGSIADRGRTYGGASADERLHVYGVHDVTGDGLPELYRTGYVADTLGHMYFIPGRETWPESGSSATLDVRHYYGDQSDDRFYMSPFVDLNGDGIKEMVGGDDDTDPNGGSNRGSVYIYASGHSLPPSGPVSSLSPAIRRYDGTYDSDSLSRGFPSAVDLNDDGYTDLVYNYKYSSPGGSIYILFGGESLPSSGTVDARWIRYDGDSSGDQLTISGFVQQNIVDYDEDGNNELLVSGAGYVGIIEGGPWPDSGAISTVGRRYDGGVSQLGRYDLTGDGEKEWLLRNWSATNNGTDSGSVYVIDMSGGLPPSGDVSTLAMRRYDGETNDRLGSGVHVTDMDADGYNDMVFRLFNYGTNAGGYSVLYGGDPLPSSGAVSVRGKRYPHTVSGEYVSLDSWVHDITGDGKKEILSCSEFTDPGSLTNAGSLWVIPSPLPASGNISDVARRYDGEYDNDYLCGETYPRIHFADINADGIDDVFAEGDDSSPNGVSDAGSMFVLLGAETLPASGPWTSAGLRYDSTTAGMGFGRFSALTNLSDINGDGITDYAVSNPSADPGGVTDGGSFYYLLAGGSLPSSGTLADAFSRIDGWLPGQKLASPSLVDLTDNPAPELVFSSQQTDVDGKTGAGSATLVPVEGGVIRSEASRSFFGRETGEAFGAYETGDYDGDGRTDLLFKGQNLDFVGGAKSLADLERTQLAGSKYGETYMGFNPVFVDLNGDGVKEIVTTATAAGDGWDAGGKTDAGGVNIGKTSHLFPDTE